MRSIQERAATLKENVMQGLADSLDCELQELGQQWEEFAEAVADVATTALFPDKQAIGRLVIATVQLP